MPGDSGRLPAPVSRGVHAMPAGLRAVPAVLTSSPRRLPASWCGRPSFSPAR